MSNHRGNGFVNFQSTPASISPLFPPGTSSEAIVKMTLMVLQTQNQREPGRVAKALAAIDVFHIKRLAALFDELLARSDSPRNALATLTKIIAAELAAEASNPMA
jgi:hypothetical protein